MNDVKVIVASKQRAITMMVPRRPDFKNADKPI